MVNSFEMEIKGMKWNQPQCVGGGGWGGGERVRVYLRA